MSKLIISLYIVVVLLIAGFAKAAPLAKHRAPTNKATKSFMDLKLEPQLANKIGN